jgi:hypothetical protein
MTLKERLIDGDILDRYDAPLGAELKHTVDQKKGITVGQNCHDLPYVQPACRFLPGILVFHGRSADYRAFLRLLPLTVGVSASSTF